MADFQTEIATRLKELKANKESAKKKAQFNKVYNKATVFHVELEAWKYQTIGVTE